MVEGEPEFVSQPMKLSISISEAEKLAEQRIQSYFEILRQRPELSPFMRPTLAQNTAHILKHLDEILAANPHILSDLEEVYTDNPEQIAMAVMPGLPLVMARFQGETWAMAPSIGCSMYAIDDLFGGRPKDQREYKVVTSHDGLAGMAWEMAERNSRAVLSYDRQTMTAPDYLALGVQGYFSNELYRVPIPARKGK